MTTEIFYKVLWVEDDLSIIDAYQSRADRKDIELDVATNWEDAEEKLRINFNEYSAIILDAQCKIKKEDTVATKFFLGHVSIRLSRIFGEKHKFIPWYILSAGTMDDFGVVLDLINTEERQNYNSVWGRLKYIKGVNEDPNNDKVLQEDILFENIKRVASSTGINTVLFRHSEVFKYLGEEHVFGYLKARKYMLKMLSSLYYPEENLNFEYEGNPLRKVIEYIFREANKFGLLPDECIDAHRHVTLSESSKYMAGKEANIKEGGILKYKVRFGKEGESIFNNEIAMIIKNILDYSSNDSHTNEDDPYIIEEDKKEIFFGYVLQLCHAIKWIGEYIDSHQDVASNRSKITIIKDSDSSAKTSTKKDKNGTNQVVTEKNVEVPSIDTIKGTEYNIMYNRNGKLACGPYCKLEPKYNTELGKKAILKHIVENEGKDAQELPYIATEIDIV